MSPQQIQRVKAAKRANIARLRVACQEPGAYQAPLPPSPPVVTYRCCDLCGRPRPHRELRQRMQERGRPIFVLSCRGGCRAQG